MFHHGNYNGAEIRAIVWYTVLSSSYIILHCVNTITAKTILDQVVVQKRWEESIQGLRVG